MSASMAEGMAVPAWHDRFWSKVEKTETCWNWTAGLTPKGYGMFASPAGKSRFAHRFLFEELNGKMQPGFYVDHTCHNKRCVNPGHLRAVTIKQNAENFSGPRSDSRSGIRGVHWIESSNRWVACLSHNGKNIHVGSYRDPLQAERDLIAKRKELFTHNDIDRRPE